MNGDTNITVNVTADTSAMTLTTLRALVQVVDVQIDALTAQKRALVESLEREEMANSKREAQRFAEEVKRAEAADGGRHS